MIRFFSLTNIMILNYFNNVKRNYLFSSSICLAAQKISVQSPNGRAKRKGVGGEGILARPSVLVLRAKRAIIWGFAQKMFELRSKNTAKFYIQRN